MRRAPWIVVIFLFLFVVANGTAQNSQYSYARAITIDHRRVVGSDQANFPVLISGTYQFLANVSYGGHVQNANGYDIVFTADAAGQQQLDHEIDSYDPVTGTVAFWVRIPALSRTTDTTIYVWYGSSSIADSQENKPGVWQNGYAAVWHFGNNSISATDSTSFGNNGSNHGVTAAAGQIGTGGNFDGTGNTYFQIPSNTSYKPTTTITLEAWINTAGVPNWAKVISLDLTANGTWNGPAYALGLFSNTLEPRLAISPTSTTSPVPVTQGQWTHIVGTYDGSNMVEYLNGAKVITTPLTGSIPYGTSQDLAIGVQSPYTFGEPVHGTIDEARISTVARSAGWIATEYNNEVSPSTFAYVSPAEFSSSQPVAYPLLLPPTTYSYARTIAIDHTKVVNSDQTDFPVLISGTFPHLATVANGGHVQNASGYDIVFTADAGGLSRLDHEIDSYDPVTGTASFWVRIPTLSYTADTPIYMWYGNSNVVASQENKPGVWRNGYSAVWHLSGTPVSPLDSTGNTSGSISNITSLAGQIGTAAQTNGTSNSYVRVANSTAVKPATAITLEGWVKPTSITAWNKIIALDYRADGSWTTPFVSYALQMNNNTNGISLHIASNGTIYSTGSAATIPFNSWSHVAGTFDTTSHLLRMFVNGVQDTNTLTNSAIAIDYGTSKDLTLGQRSPYSAGDAWTGGLDELRISAVARSANWIATEYNNQSSPSTFIIVSSTEFAGAPPDPYVPLAAPSSYAHSLAGSIDHTQVANSDQSDFPVLISGTFPFLATVSNGGGVQNVNGYDIIFTADQAGQTRLDHEIDSYDPATGSASFWVRIPSLSHTADTPIYVWYGNSSVTGSQENKPGVWRNGYVAVYHLGKNGAISAADSTGTNSGVVYGVSSASGEIGTAGSFAANSSSYIQILNSTSIKPAGALTLEGWVNPTSFSGGYNKILALDYRADGTWNAPFASYALSTTNSGAQPGLHIAQNGTLHYLTASGSLPLSAWSHVAGTFDGNTMRMYLNGVQDPTTLSTPGIIDYGSSRGAAIGKDSLFTSSSVEGWNGLVDELRISSVARGADWIATEYNNETQSLRVQIASPASGAIVSANGPISIDANVSRANPFSTITKVEFFSDGVKIGESTSAPYGISVTIASGTHAITAMLTDSLNHSVTSASITITSESAAPQITSIYPSYGPPGTTVTLTGANFTTNVNTGNAVAFGGMSAASIVSWTDTQIKATVPATTGDVPVGVTVAGVTSNTVTFTVTSGSEAGSAPASYITGKITGATSPVDLTASGTLDWAAWALQSASSFDHKGNVLQQISNFTVLGSANPFRNYGMAPGFTWTDGTPDASASNDVSFVGVCCVGTGFQITVPADTVGKTLRIYAVAQAGSGETLVPNFEASLGDGSAQPYVTQSSLPSFNGMYAVHFRSATPGQTLTVKYTVASGATSSVALEAATLSPDPVTLLSPTDGATYAWGATVPLIAYAADPHGVAKVEFFDNGVKIGESSTAPYQLSITGPSSGSHILTAVLTNTLGGTATSDTINVTVGLPPGMSETQIDGSASGGSSHYNANGTITIDSPGSGYRMLYQTVQGDVQVVARVTAPGAGTAGVIISDAQSSTAAMSNLYVASNGIVTAYGRSTDGGSSYSQQTSKTVPIWLKLVRVGSSIASYTSADGSNWVLFQASSVTLGSPLYVGLMAQQTTGATFDNFSVTVPTVGAPRLDYLSTNYGTPGTSVTITGENLGNTQGSSTVSMGGIPATVSGWNNNTIVATVPNGAPLSAPITTTVSGVTSNALNFYNTPVPPPIVISHTGSGTIRGGSTETLRATVTVARATNDTGTNVIPIQITGLTNQNDLIMTCVAPAQAVPDTQGCYVPEGTNTFQYDLYVNVPNSTEILANVNAAVEYFGDPGQSINVDIAVNHAHLTIAPELILSTQSNTAEATVTVDAPLRATSAISIGASQAGVVTWPSNIGISANSTSTTFALTGQTAGDTDVTATYADASTAPVSVRSFGGDPELGECKDCKLKASNPVNLANGNVWITESDYSLPGLGGGISLSRTWNSLWSAGANIEQIGMFGDSWRSTYEQRLKVLDSTTIQYVRSDGSSWFFLYVNGAWALGSPADEQATLSFDTTTTNYTLTFQNGSSETFNNSGYLIGLSDRNGNETTVSIDATNRITQVTDAAGRSLWFDYPDGNTRQVQAIHDAVGIIATYAYDASSRLSSVTYADTAGQVYHYDSNSLITSVTDELGVLLEAHTYDGLRRGLTSNRAGGADSISLDYTTNGTTQLTDSASHTTTYNYAYFGGRRKASAIAGPGCASCGGRNDSSFSYDAFGNNTLSTDALNHDTTFTYDAAGNVTSRSAALDANTTQTWQYTYNSFGEVLTATDPLGHVTTNSYDSHGNLLSVTTPAPDANTAASVTTFAYDTKGQLTSITDPLTHTTTITYTAAGLVETVTDANNKVTSYEYDDRGNRTAAVDALNQRTTFEYDARNRLKKITYPDQTTTQFGYDTRGRRTSVTDQNGKITSYAYDDADRLTSVTDAKTNITQYAYDTENNLTGITDALNHTTTFAYDSLGRVTSTTFPSTLVESYTYDAVGNLHTKTDRKSQTTTYTYDPLNRLTRKQYPDTSGVDYTYDLGNRLTQAADVTGTYGFSYDNMGRLTVTTTAYSFLPSRTFTNAYTYDAASNRVGYTDPESGTVSYGYDVLNRLTSLNSSLAGQFTFGYDDLSRRTSLTRPNGINTSYTYDSLSRLLSVLHQSGGTTIDGATYTVDNAGNRATKQNWLNSTTDTYSYDDIYELTQVVQNLNGTTESYSYDDVGNRLSSLGLSPYSYNTSNQLTSTPNASFTYDNNGNTLTKTDTNGETQYAWDYENRLTSVTLPGSSIVSFKYDPFGRRIQKSSVSGTTNYVYDGANVAEEVTALGGVTARYVQGAGIDEPLAESRGGLYFYAADGLGSITSLMDSAGANAATYTYDMFGNLIASTGGVVNPYRYTAREYDPETGLYYYRARYYDPGLGRFLNEDPMFFDGNGYEYVDNDPVLKIDPTGYDGIVINYDYYPITVAEHLPICECKAKLPLGHGAAVAVDPKTGRTEYFEYGRYESDFGNVRQMPVPNVVIGSDGHPTQASLDNLYDYISKHYGHNSHVSATYYRDADYNKIVRFAKQRMNDKHRKPYNILTNNCKTFAKDAVNAGRQ